MRAIDFFDKGVALDPQAPAFWTEACEYSYAEMKVMADRIGAGITARSAAADPHVAVYSPNDPRAFGCMLGGFRAGGVWVPINARNAVESNIDFMNAAEAEWLFYHSTFAEPVQRMRSEVHTLRHFVCIDDDCGDDPSLATFMQREGAGPVPDVPHARDRLATVMGTGGTTGKSKGVMITNQMWETMIAIGWMIMPCEETPVHLVVAPLTHGAGALTLMLLPRGAKNVILDKAEPAAILRAIEQHRVTHLFLPPTAFYNLLAQPEVRDFDYSSLRYFLVAAAPVSPEKIKEGISVFGPVICQCWGQAESPFFLTWMPPTDFVEACRPGGNEKRLWSCGKATILCQVETMDEEGRLLPTGQRGELVARSNLVTPGYYKNTAATAEISAFGWHHTGDIGYRDEDGYFYIVDRKKDMIVSGGFNVFSAEVEHVVNGHPAVEDCVVIGVPDAKWGEAVKAVVKLKAGHTAAADEIIALCKEKLGGVKAPKSVDFVEDLPRSPVGKVLKRAVRERYWQGQKRAVS
jgi:acyl-CoA synthetase (AMP-forming)/AMP-acid ligase II